MLLRFITGALRAEIEYEKQVLAREQNPDREAYQKLLSEKNTLEAQVELLERTAAGMGHHRSLSDASTISIQENARGSPDGGVSVNQSEVRGRKKMERRGENITRV